MRKALLVCAAVGCLAGLYFETLVQQCLASLIGIVLPILVYCLWNSERKWHQYSLRTLLGAITLFAIGLTASTYWVGPVYERHQVVAEVKRLGGLYSLTPTGQVFVLDFRDVSFTDDNLARLSVMRGNRHVVGIRLYGTSVTDAGVLCLANFPTLRHVDIRDCKLTDKGMQQLRDMPRLTAISVYRCNGITDEGLRGFEDCQGLALLSLKETSVTATKAAALRKSLPACDVVHSF